MTGLDPVLVNKYLVLAFLIFSSLIIFGQLFLAKRISLKSYQNYKLVLSVLALLVVVIFNYYFGHDEYLIFILVIYALYNFLEKVWKSGERFRS
jgi:hypothetical protein